jgi:outer membrane protein assembly factor BamB
LILLALTWIAAGCKSGGNAPTCSLSDPASLADSSWPKFRHDLQNTGHIDQVTISNGVKRAGTFVDTTGMKLAASPVLGQGDARIYIGGTDGIFYVLNSDVVLNSDGSSSGDLSRLSNDEFTQFTALSAITGTALAAVRFRSSSEAVFFTSDDGTVQALDSTGKVQPNFWPFSTGAQNATSPTLNGVDGTVYFASGSLFFGVCPNGIQRFGYSFRLGVHSSAGVGVGGTAYFGGDDLLVRAIDPNGTIRWTFSASAPIPAAPIVELDDPDKPKQTVAIYVIDSAGRVFKIDANGKPVPAFHSLQLPSGVTSSSPALAGDRIYVGSDAGTLFAIDKNNGGAPLWSFPTGDRIRTSPAVATGGGQTVIVFGSDDGNLYLVADEGTSARLVASVPLGAKMSSSPAIRRNDDGSASIYVGTDDGHVYLVQ